MTKTFIKNPWTNAAVWGLTGALLALISIHLPFDKTWKKEVPMILSFTGCLIGLFYSIHVGPGRRKSFTIFFAALVTWMIMFVVPHIILAVKYGGYDSFWWAVPFFQASGAGVLICALLTCLAIRFRKDSLTLEAKPDSTPL